MESYSRRGAGIFGVIGLIAVVLVAGVAGVWLYRSSAVSFDTPYQAVLLTNGQVFYGRLQGYGSRHPVLREVYYVRGGLDPQTREQTNTLVKRGSEWHGPDKMLLNPEHIILVEPVNPNSRVAQLIVELRNR